MTRRTWVVDIWADDDPGLVRMREALALRPPEPEPEPTIPAQPPATAEPAHEPEPEAPAPEPRHDRMGELIARVRAGDLSAVDMLRRLVDR